MLILVSPALADSCATKWSKSLSSTITAASTDEYSNITYAGTVDGYVTAIFLNGSVAWNLNFGYPIWKIKSSQSSERVGVMTNYGMYILNGTNGDIIYSKNISNVLDFDMSKNGSLTAFIWGTYNFTVVNYYGTDVIDHGWLENYEIDGYTAYRNITIASDGSWIVLGTSTNKLYLFNITDNSKNWYQGYKYRKEVIITGSQKGYILREDNVTVKLTLYNTTGGLTTGGTVYIGSGRTQPDWDDVRFIQKSNSEVVQYQLVTTGSNYAIFNLSFYRLDENENATIYIYYGNSSAEYNGTILEILQPYVSVDDGYNQWFESNYGWDQYGQNNGTLTIPDTNWYTQGNGSGSLYVNPVHTGTYPSNYYYIMNSVVGLPPVNANGSATGFGYYAKLDTRISWNMPGGEYSYCYGINGGAFIAYEQTIIYSNPLEQGTSGTDTATNLTVTTESNKKISASINLRCYHTSSGWAKVYMDNIRLQKAFYQYPPQVGMSGYTEFINGGRYTSTGIVAGNIVAMDTSETGDYLLVGTTTYLSLIPITPSKFGTTTSVSSNGDLFSISMANNGAFWIEGRSISTSIYRQDGVKVGFYSTGGYVKSVDISQTNGLWAIAGSTDGIAYVFSKESMSSWYTYWQTNSLVPVTVVFSNWRGSYFGIGRMDGSFTLIYPTTSGGSSGGSSVGGIYTPNEFYQEIFVFRNGKAIIGDVVTVSVNTSPTMDDYNEYFVGTTDSHGKIVYKATSGYYYKVNVNNGEKIETFAATSTRTYYIVNINSPVMSSRYSFRTEYNDTSKKILMSYIDNQGVASSITFRVVNVANNTEVYNTSGIGSSLTAEYYDPSSGTLSYRVYMEANRYDGSTVRDSRYVQSSNTWKINLSGVDSIIRNAIFTVMIMVIAGLFSYTNNVRGAIIVVFIGAAFTLFGLVDVPWWIIAMAGTLAILGAFGKGSGWR